MTIDISNNAARVNYTVASGVTQTSFSVPFEFFNDSDLSVYVDDVLKTITTHYTVSGGDGSTGTITMSVTGAAGGSTVVISRSIAIERTSDFQTGVDINRAALNTQLDTLTAIAADNQDKANRSISAPNSEVNPVLELPDADTRKGKLIGFNETTGNIELSATLADGNTLASISGDIATLADIEDGTDATDAIQTAASISSDITTAASNITEIQNASANAATATTKAAEAATSASNAATSATNASTSETNAATSETNAATSASTATTQAGISTTKAAESAASAAAALDSENAAATSESNASTSESNASTSATASETSKVASVAAQAAAETAETNAETAQTAAEAAQAAAETAETNAATSETNAASSAASASTDAGTATTKAGEAAASATASANSATASEAAKDAALAALDNFDDRYLGQKASDPTLDNDGDALVAGALYFNTTDDVMKVYEGSVWVAAYASLSGALLVANNLSDVADATASRTNLGLGTGDSPTFTGITSTSGDLDLDTLDLNAIAETIADTAVDVFVYDTSKDSDGGAWRKRTQGTSWYNETLNTATRGSRREFPAVAVIVAEAAKVTIYDGDDPALPMWMVFNVAGNKMLYVSGVVSSASVSVLNGEMYVGHSTNSNGFLKRVSFTQDVGYLIGTSGVFPSFTNTISVRNGSLNGSYVSSSPSIVNTNVNDVAMTVLPNAPIDAATGLPVPTIAVATAGGVSVIKDDGTVVDLTRSTDPMGTVSFNEDGVLVFTNGSVPTASARAWYYKPEQLTSDISLDAEVQSFVRPSTSDITDGTTPYVGDWYNGGEVAVANNTVFGAPSISGKLYRSYLSDFVDNPNHMANVTTSTYSTGWMPGDIKGAFLSDTDDTDLVDTEFATLKTPDVACSPSGITLSGSTLTINAEVGVPLGSTITEPFVGLQENTSYVLTFTKTTGAGGGTQSAWIGVGYGVSAAGSCSFGSHYGSKTLGNLPAGDYSLHFTTGTRIGDVGLFLRSVNTTSDFTHTLNNVSVRLVDADRSVNANPLNINGTVTRSPVATGADLVAYSGFSASNYLAQPYNSDLDFGTGDFCIMGWIYVKPNATNYLMDRKGTDRCYFFMDSNHKLGYGLAGGQFSITGTQVPQDSWAHIVFVRENGVIHGYVNGTLQASSSNSISPTSFGGTGDEVLYVSSAYTGGYSPESSALFRISATAPTAEQIKKIYEDEKVLFQENAQATLYGSSDAVTALAYDDTTELLHVGTSAGRSVFQGLRRVDNTTTAVGTAISASNSLVVEE